MKSVYIKILICSPTNSNNLMALNLMLLDLYLMCDVKQ